MAFYLGDAGNNNYIGTQIVDRIAGGGGNDNLIGDYGDDFLGGDDGDDILNGGFGFDSLIGGAGADTYVLNSFLSLGQIRDPAQPYSYFYGNTNGDRIELVSGEDTIRLVRTSNLYLNLPLGTVTDDFLRAGPGIKTAADANDYLIYDTTAGILYYDVDGTGPTEAVDIVRTGAGVPLVAADIEVVTLNSVRGTTGGDNLVGTNGDDLIAALEGSDMITGSGGNDSIIAWTGRDIVRYAGAKADYSVFGTNIAYVTNVVDNNTSDGDAGIDSLTMAERLRFDDLSVALDVLDLTAIGVPDWQGNAGKVAKTAGAVFGAPMVKDTGLIGLGLFHMDRVNNYTTLMQMALNAKLGVDATDRQVVDLLYTNVVGTAPSEDMAQFYMKQLAEGRQTHATLGVLAADTTQNATNIDLVGLRTNGLAYLEVS